MYDLRGNKNQYDDIVFTIDKSNVISKSTNTKSTDNIILI